MKFQGSKTLFLFFGLALLLWIFPGLDDLERWTLDERFRWRAPRSVPDDIVIVNIDRSQPWTREQPPFAWNPWFGRFIGAMNAASASCVMLDMIYSRSPDSYLLRHIEEVLSKHRVTISREILHDLSFDIPYTAGIDRSKIQRA